MKKLLLACVCIIMTACSGGKDSTVFNVLDYGDNISSIALSEKIVRLHNGKIDIDSTYGKGTTIKIILNTADDPDSYDETGDDEDE